MKYQTQYRAIQKTLGIQYIASVRFSNTKAKTFLKYKDTACTALGRCLKFNKSTYIDRKQGQLCSGGNYFLKIKSYPPQEVMNVYTKQEQVFASNKACKSFLKQVPNYPKQASTRYILLTPLARETQPPAVVIMIINPAQAARLLGLSVFKGMIQPHLLPAAPTCMSLYASLTTQRPHINLIDYYDRYYQGKIGTSLLWNDNEMLFTLPYHLFYEMIQHFSTSPHGDFIPLLQPQRVDSFT